MENLVQKNDGDDAVKQYTDEEKEYSKLNTDEEKLIQEVEKNRDNNDKPKIWKRPIKWAMNLLSDSPGNALLVFSGLAYCFGFFVVHLYLMKLGFYQFNLMKADYLVIGSIWLFFYALALMVVGNFMGRLINYNEISPKFIGQACFAAFFVIAIISIIHLLKAEKVNFPFIAWHFCVILLFAASALTTRLTLFIISEVFEGHEDNHTLKQPLLIFLSIVLLGGCLYFYAIKCFPHYPRPLGGGELVAGKILVDKNYAEELYSLGLMINIYNGESEEITIVHHTDKDYFISSGDASYEIPRSKIIAVKIIN